MAVALPDSQAEHRAFVAESAHDVLLAATRNVFLTATGVSLAWLLLLGMAQSEWAALIMPVAMLMSATAVLALRLLPRRATLAQASFLTGVGVALGLSARFFERPELLFLAVLLPLIGASSANGLLTVAGGILAAALIWVWRLGDVIKANPEFKWGVGALPYGLTGLNAAPLFNDSWMLGAKCRQPQAGFKFLKYLTLENGAKLYAEQVGFFPAKKDLYNLFFDSIMKVPNIAVTREDLVKAITGGFAGGFPTPGKTLDRFPELNTAWTQTTGPLKNGEATVPDGMKAVQAKFKSLIGA